MRDYLCDFSEEACIFQLDTVQCLEVMNGIQRKRKTQPIVFFYIILISTQHSRTTNNTALISLSRIPHRTDMSAVLPRKPGSSRAMSTDTLSGPL